MREHEPGYRFTPELDANDGPRRRTTIGRTNRTAIRLLIAALTASAVVQPATARAGELDRMSPDLFAHYARTRLAELAGAARSARKVEREFHERCRTTRDARQRASDCEVAREVRHHLKQLVTEEREVMEHLRRDGQADHSWVSTEHREFWEEVRNAPRTARPLSPTTPPQHGDDS